MKEERKILGLRFILFLAYLAIGAAVFWYLENEKQLMEFKAIWTVINQTVRKCNITEMEMQTLISPYFETSVIVYGRWNYGNSFVFAFTTVTTIGNYFHIFVDFFCFKLTINSIIDSTTVLVYHI